MKPVRAERHVMAEKQVGLREQVKKGLLTADAALLKVFESPFQNPSIVSWLQSRIRRGVKVEPPKAPEPAPAKKAEKFLSKSEERRVKIQREHGKKRG